MMKHGEKPSEPAHPCRSVSLLIPLAIALASWVAAYVCSSRREAPAGPSGKREDRGGSLHVRFLNEREGGSAIREAHRAIVFVDAPYSVPALNNGKEFLRGMVYLRQQRPDLGAEIFWIEDDSQDWCKEWVTSLGVEGLLGVAVPVGNGAVIWLERGKVVAFKLGHKIKDAYELKEATLRLWPAGTGNTTRPSAPARVSKVLKNMSGERRHLADDSQG